MWLSFECSLWWLRKIYFVFLCAKCLPKFKMTRRNFDRQTTQKLKRRTATGSEWKEQSAILLCCLYYLRIFLTSYLDGCKDIWATVRQNYLWTVTHLKPSNFFSYETIDTNECCNVTGSILKNLISSLHTMIPQSCSLVLFRQFCNFYLLLLGVSRSIFLISFQHYEECGLLLTFDRDLLSLKVVQVAQQHLLPITSVAD